MVLRFPYLPFHYLSLCLTSDFNTQTNGIRGGGTVVVHLCLCMNPEGTRADNKRDDWDHWANGTDHALL